MTDSELILRAGLAAFSDADRVVAVNLDRFDPLNSRDDLVRLLLATGISFSRPSNIHIAAEAAGDTVKVTIENGDELAAAARAACELAASWVHDDDVEAWAIATRRSSRPRR
ncbi:hypothetical protein AAGS40_27340 (plasmid) [Paraburkholderia sp. PREW-6R]|uniref:hypothetical protein n=1 Tax=Paraburkholderia sp. PREW-6R TaxID=3141544 RepID=UPI0031F58947